MEVGTVLSPHRSGPIQITPHTSAETQLEQARHTFSLGLKEVKKCNAHSHVMNIVGGGPSLEDTYKELDGYIAAINGSLGFLKSKGILAHACGMVDPRPDMAQTIEALDGVRYYIASICHRSVFEKLANNHVTVWHPSGVPGLEELLIDRGFEWGMIGGGCSMGLRWIDIGYVLGFRKFKLFGMDSSFRDGKSHSYDDIRSRTGTLTVDGFETRPEFLRQANNFIETLKRFDQDDMEPTEIEVIGDGLLPHFWRKYERC